MGMEMERTRHRRSDSEWGALEGVVGRISRQLPRDNYVDDAESSDELEKGRRPSSRLALWRSGDLADLTDSVANC